MRGFVASWFFPPATSSEGIVAFKLLSHSQHRYDVCSSLSRQWGYDAELPLSSPNIEAITIATDSVDEWVDFAVAEFERRHAVEPYDFVMTRSMPPESIEVGRRIKQAHPEVPWVASLGDPISRVPHMMRNFLDKTKSLTKSEKAQLKRELDTLSDCSGWVGKGDGGIDILCQYKAYEVAAVRHADMLVFPNGPQAHFMLCGLRRKNVSVIPHTFDSALYPDSPAARGDGKVELVFLGQAYKDRSTEPLIHALHLLQVNNPSALEKIHLRLIGDVTDDTRSLIWDYYLNDVVSIESGVSYLESLAIMSQADWLVHVDGYFQRFSSTGGSVYLAGKLADYIGARKPILAMTGVHSPADRLVRQYGGLVYDAWDKQALADGLERIALGTERVEIDGAYASLYEARSQAAVLDRDLQAMMDSFQAVAPEAAQGLVAPVPSEPKLLSVCVPSYNVEMTLARTLDSLVGCERPELLDVMVVNDGSRDGTRELALRYQSRYPGIVRLIDKENGGHGSTINAALRHAAGTYFKVVDGDDWLDPIELGRLLSKLEGLSEEVDLISTDYCQVNIETGKIDPIRKKTPKIAYDRVYRLDKLDVSKEYFSMHSTVYRTQLLRDCGLRLFENMFYVDVQYQMFPLPYVRTVMFTDGNLYHYAVGSSEQSVSRSSLVARYDNHDAVIRSALDYYLANLEKMPVTVAAYYEMLILKHFIKTQLIVNLQYDDDVERGLARAKDFDEYLRMANPYWYDKAAELYTILVPLRRCSFDPNQAPKTSSLQYETLKPAQRLARKAARKVMAGGIGTVVAGEVTKKQKKRR